MASNQAAGSIVSLLSAFLNKKQAPQTIPYQNVSAQDEQQRAISGNNQAESSIEDLLGRANSYTQDQATSLMEKAMPGFTQLSKQALTQAGSNLANPYALPSGVSDNLSRIASERGISTGVQGQAGDFSLLRDLGVNMLDYGNNRINQAQSLMSTIGSLAPRVSPMSPLSFYVTPQQQIGVTTDNNTKTQAILQGGANAMTAAKNWNTQQMWDSLNASAGKADSTAQYGWEQFGGMMTGGLMGGGGGG